MSTFQTQIEQIFSFLEQNGIEKLKSLPVDIAGIADDDFYKKGRGSGIVLKSDTYMELGNPETGSAEVLLYEKKAGEDGIFLIGPDLEETEGLSLPFGGIILLCGKKMTDECYYQVVQNHSRLVQVDGFMVKSDGDNVWCRVSKKAVENGFDFAILGNVLIRRIKEAYAEVENVKIFFLCKETLDIASLRSIAAEVKSVAHSVKAKVWHDRGFDFETCSLGGHCGECSDQKICDNVRKMQKEMRDNRKV